MIIIPLVSLTIMMSQNALEQRLQEVVIKTKAQFSDLKSTDFAISYVSVDRKSDRFISADYNGDLAMYPASVVKMFYMAYAEQLLEQKKLTLDPELERALKDMIVESNNDATGLVLDTITGTTGGSYLAEKELKKWMDKRGAVNRWLASLGYIGINCNQKTWNEGPYGREKQGYGPKMELRNSLTANACTRMLREIVTDKINTPARCEAMRKLLSRKPASEDSQVPGFIGSILPTDALLWSKAGWTSTVRHDVAYVKHADKEFVLAIFTRYKVEDPALLKFIANEMIKSK
jgi:beta-lactamase class A